MSASTVHDAEHERLLHEALVLADGDVPAAIADCPACIEALEELRDVSRLLDETARDERETLAALDWDAPAPGDHIVAPFLRERLEQRARRPMARGRALALRYAAAAAAVLTVGWFARELVAPDPVGDGARVLLGEEGLRQLAPSGDVATFEPFTWSFQENVDGWFEVQVSDMAGNPRGRSGQLTEPRWDPEPSETAWPDEIRWTVTAYHASGARISTRSTTARIR